MAKKVKIIEPIRPRILQNKQMEYMEESIKLLKEILKELKRNK